MRVLLIQPPFTIFKTEAKVCHPPLGLAYLAAVLKKEHDVSVLDALAEGYDEETELDEEFVRYGMPFDKIGTAVERFRPDVVGISCLFSAQFKNVKAVAGLVKEMDRDITTVVGGAHPSAVPEEALEGGDIDFAIIGEGEGSVGGLLESLEKKSGKAELLDGLAFRCDAGVKVCPKRQYLQDLDGLPFPRWEAFPLKDYFRINAPHGGPARRVPFLPLVTSRGCPFECIFCSVHNLWGRGYRKRSSENVLTELERLVREFGVREILFEDDNLTFDRRRAKEIFRGMIDRGLKISWSMPNGVAMRTLDDEMLELMKASGCHSLSFGVESGDEYILKDLIRKPIALEMVKPVVAKARQAGLETTAFFVVGFPGETRAQLQKTFRLAGDLNADNVNFFFATPLPGTRLLELCRKTGLVKAPLDYSRLKSDYPVFATEAYSARELKSAVLRERIKLYFLFALRNPHRFLRKLLRKLVKEPKYFARFVLKYRSALKLMSGRGRAKDD